MTARDSLEWYDQKQIAVARGDAVAVKRGRKHPRRHAGRRRSEGGRRTSPLASSRS